MKGQGEHNGVDSVVGQGDVFTRTHNQLDLASQKMAGFFNGCGVWINGQNVVGDSRKFSGQAAVSTAHLQNIPSRWTEKVMDEFGFNIFGIEEQIDILSGATLRQAQGRGSSSLEER